VSASAAAAAAACGRRGKPVAMMKERGRELLLPAKATEGPHPTILLQWKRQSKKTPINGVSCKYFIFQHFFSARMRI
jgi:hypothetical protein